ncbi:CPCC family cysteine-rich protein [Corallincola platygyrae]|uniref:CPCC family cysteine-rich protein n=1 Tax=Corallincola platygyrae TaxID=1193278 RepID=A0ABW4XK95_9GAMM
MTDKTHEATCQPLLYQCPCCDHFTLEQRGRYEICPVCFWEDEPLLDDDEGSAANHGVSLTDARINFLTLGASYPEMKKHVIPENKRLQYDHKQRPVIVPKARLAS